ncbi:UbiA-domain-containing protein [Atractiella rhizophila]|nr:UbiA-domain-containing protein [Atractiella rhizophila]
MSRLALRTSLHSFHNGARPHLNYSSPLFRHATTRRSFTLPARLHGLKPYFELARLDKPIGTWLLYLPCTWGISMACYSSHAPPSVWLGNLALFGFGAVIMRGAGCTINDMWDSGIDAKVARTKGRPLAAGQLSYQKAWSFLALQLSGGLAVLSQLNTYRLVPS